MIWGLLAALVVIALPLSCIGIGGYYAWTFVSAPLDQAVVSMEQDAVIVEKLGKPLTKGTGIGINNYSNQNGNGGADVDFNVNGPKGSAHVKGRMELTAGVWRPAGLKIDFSDGKSVTIGE